MNKIPLKIWIGTYFILISIALWCMLCVIMSAELTSFLKYVAIFFLSSFGSLVVYYLVLQKEFEKMQKEYEKAGNLKKIVKKWKEGDTE